MKKYFVFIFSFFLSIRSVADQSLCMSEQFNSAVGMSADCFDSNSPIICGLYVDLLGFAWGMTLTGILDDMRGNRARRVGAQYVDSKDKFLESIEERQAFIKRLKKAGYGGETVKSVEEDLENMSKNHVKQKAEYERLKSILDHNKNEGRISAAEYEKELEKIRPKVDQRELRVLFNLGFGGKENMFRRSMIGGAIGLIAGATAPISIGWANRKICSKSIPFSSEEDLEIFKKYADVYMPCQTGINEEKYQDLMSLSLSERQRLFQKSPALCKAFEQQGTRQISAILESKAEIITSRISCGSNEIVVPYMADGTRSKIKFVKDKNTISLLGSFTKDEFSEEYDKTKFTVALKKDLTWSGVSTPNRVWGTAPGAYTFISDPTNLRKFMKENPSCLKSLKRNEVELQQSTTGLYCAVAQQLVVADQLIDKALEKCPEFGGPEMKRQDPVQVRPADSAR